MCAKRTADELDVGQPRIQRRAVKRTKLSPATEKDGNSSEPSSCSVSEDSALRSSPPASENTRQSSISSIPLSTLNDDSESSLSSSSDGSSDPESDDEITYVGGPKKPRIAPAASSVGTEPLSQRLAAFLPQMAEANESLASATEGYSLEDVDDDERHIEMNLGLGVLEERGNSSSSEESSDSDDELPQHEDAPTSSGTVKRLPADITTNVLQTLMGRPPSRREASIQDLG